MPLFSYILSFRENEEKIVEICETFVANCTSIIDSLAAAKDCYSSLRDNPELNAQYEKQLYDDRVNKSLPSIFLNIAILQFLLGQAEPFEIQKKLETILGRKVSSDIVKYKEQAQTHCQQVELKKATPLELDYIKIITLVRSGKLADALKQCDRLTKSNPSHYKAIWLGAKICEELEQYPRALARYNEVCKKSPQSVYAERAAKDAKNTYPKLIAENAIKIAINTKAEEEKNSKEYKILHHHRIFLTEVLIDSILKNTEIFADDFQEKYCSFYADKIGYALSQKELLQKSCLNEEEFLQIKDGYITNYTNYEYINCIRRNPNAYPMLKRDKKTKEIDFNAIVSLSNDIKQESLGNTISSIAKSAIEMVKNIIRCAPSAPPLSMTHLASAPPLSFFAPEKSSTTKPSAPPLSRTGTLVGTSSFYKSFKAMSQQSLRDHWKKPLSWEQIISKWGVKTNSDYAALCPNSDVSEPTSPAMSESDYDPVVKTLGAEILGNIQAVIDNEKEKLMDSSANELSFPSIPACTEVDAAVMGLPNVPIKIPAEPAAADCPDKQVDSTTQLTA